jgi:hypothetical protein
VLALSKAELGRRSQTVTPQISIRVSWSGLVREYRKQYRYLNTITGMADVQVCSHITTPDFCYVL